MCNAMTADIKYILSQVWPYRIVRISLATIFIYAGVVKLFDPKAFARVISAYDIIPEMLLPVFAVGLPFIETVAGIGLLLDIKGTLTVISSLMVLFILVLGYGVLQNLNIDCGCFGAEELSKQASLKNAFWRDLVLGGAVIPYLYFSRYLRSKISKTSENDNRAP
jgi:uncharacterized membrane protein YphA (DoxX/SURF4 family)